MILIPCCLYNMDFKKYTIVIWSVVSMSSVVNAAVNLATGNIVTNQSSTYTVIKGWVSSKAVDGCTSQRISPNCCTHTDVGQTEVWWQVDLRQQSVIERVKIIYRNEESITRLAGFEIYLSDTSDWISGVRCYQDNTASLELMTATQDVACVDEESITRLAGFEIYLSDTSDWISGVRCYQDNTASLELMTATQDVACVGVGRYVTLYNNRTVKARTWYSDMAFFELCEVYVFGCTVGKFGNGHCNDDCLTCNICHPTSGECYCNDGYYGATCTPCPIGCSTNTCDQTSGNCNHCDVGFYSDHCDQNCPSNCKNNVCNKVNGQCAECIVGLFGNHCDKPCPGNCENQTCNKDSGRCIDCNDGYYGPSCTPCPTGCSANTRDRTSGNCLKCDIGFFGNQCDQRCPGNCKNNICHKENALCTECISGFHGNICDQTCPDNCGNSICNIQNGQCLIPFPEKQTGNNTCSTTELYTGYAVLGAFLGISVCFNICLIVWVLRQAKKTKSPNDPPEAFGMQQSLLKTVATRD